MLAIRPHVVPENVDPSILSSGVPVMHIHGTADRMVPYDGGRIAHTGDPSLSVERTIETWVRANHASPVPSEAALPDLTDDGTRVVRYRYASPSDSEAVVLYKVVGGGHAWPGQAVPRRRDAQMSSDISATQLMWAFFKTHPKASR